MGRSVIKTPVEMDAEGNLQRSFKKSKSGQLVLLQHQSTREIKTFNALDIVGPAWSEDLLVPVFENGRLLEDWTFEGIRERAMEVVPVI
jgi:nicotinamide phosphoribosyltransferase